MPNRDGINTAHHPGRQVGRQWTTHTQYGPYGGYPEYYSGWENDGTVTNLTVSQDVGPGRSSGSFMAGVEMAHRGQPMLTGTSGPYKTESRAKMASEALANRAERKSVEGDPRYRATGNYLI